MDNKMKDSDIETIFEKINSLHEKILKSKFAEKVTESEIMSLILAVQTINRQKAEIERYKGVIKILEKDVADAKAEAIKEFAERLKDKAELYSDLPFEAIAIDDIDTLVKEMVGE